MTKIVCLREVTLLMKDIADEQVKKIKHRVIEACKNDSGHTMKLCTDSD
ncbi:MAG: hypothetical protein WD717_00105 [Nitrosarchaeum sp.]